ncbi:unnamed protein product [Phaedon cochleariae]|uniref:Uncharacterized protein n=1 Tax=Phaedon cochleariae TaxID=80249 RepID=A0A9P0DGF9_PHACE|nr:unnamed protein product [Phaedon cochleariae]
MFREVGSQWGARSARRICSLRPRYKSETAPGFLHSLSYRCHSCVFCSCCELLHDPPFCRHCSSVLQVPRFRLVIEKTNCNCIYQTQSPFWGRPPSELGIHLFGL